MLRSANGINKYGTENCRPNARETKEIVMKMKMRMRMEIWSTKHLCMPELLAKTDCVCFASPERRVNHIKWIISLNASSHVIVCSFVPFHYSFDKWENTLGDGGCRSRSDSNAQRFHWFLIVKMFMNVFGTGRQKYTAFLLERVAHKCAYEWLLNRNN